MRDWSKAFVKSPMASSIKFNPGPSRIQAFVGNQLIFTASTKQEQHFEHNVWDKIESKKYATICPYCGAPHNPNEMRCEYCGGYMKKE